MMPTTGPTLPMARTATKTASIAGQRLSAVQATAASLRCALFLLLAACLLFAGSPAAQAQSAIVAGQLTSFGSTLTNAVGVATDSSQNAYVLTSTGAVYKETLTAAPGTYSETYLFTTAASAGSGIAVDSAGGNIFVATGAANTVVRYTGSGTSYTASTTVFPTFTGSTNVAVDSSGNAYITDASSGYLWKETLSGSTYTGNRITTGLGAPAYVAVDSSGNVFVSNAAGTIYEVTGSNTTYTKANTGISGFSGITGLAVDASDNLFVTGTNANIATGAIVYKATLSGSTYTAAPYYQTGSSVALDTAGNVYLVSASQASGNKLTVGKGFLDFGSVYPGSPASITVAFTVTSSGSSLAKMNTPTAVTQGLTGYDYTLGSGSTCTAGTYAIVGHSCTVVVQFSPQASGSRLGAVNFLAGGKTLASSFLGGVGYTPLAAYQSVTLLNTIACPGTCSSSLPNGLSNGRGITVDPAGNVWVANSTAAQILKFPSGSSTPVVFSTSSSCQPVGTAVDGAGNVFFTCNGESNIYELVGGAGTPVAIPISYTDTSGTTHTETTDDHLSVDAAGNLYPTSYRPDTNLFLKVAASTHAVTVLASAPTSARFVGAVTDAAGNTFAPDYNNDVLYELPAGSSTLKVLYSGSPLQAPHAIAEDAAGSLYVTTTVPNTTGNGNSPLLRFTAGNYTATPASLSVPGGDSLYITPDGDFYTVYSNTTLAVYSRSLFALTYASTAVGQTSDPQTVVLENDGTAPLTISPPGTGKNPSLSSNFTYDPSSTCSQLSINSAAYSLAASSSCTQIIRFTPQQAGSISGSVVTTDNSANVSGSTQTISITGTATQGTPTVTVSSASGTLGQSVQLSATVTGGGVTPTGSLTFTVGSGPTVNATCSGNGSSETCTATYPTGTGVNAGANTITAAVAQDSNYLASSGTGTLSLAAAPTTSTVTSDTNPSTYGTSVKFTAHVSSSYGTPTGTVTFYDGSTSIGTGSLSAGVATFTTSTLLGGTHAITVGYTATGNFAASTSSAVNQVVKTTASYGNVLTSSSMTPSFGSTVTFTDTLTGLNGVAPTGTVDFFSGTTKIGSASVNSSGVATFATSTLPVGTESITATYNGDTNYSPTTSAAVQENVVPASVLSGLITSNASPTFGASVTLTEQLPILANTPPTGTVTFFNGSVVLGIVPVDPSGNTKLITTSLPAGTDTVKAVYGGDGNYNPSTSNPVTETVAKANVATFTLASSNTSPVYGTNVTFTANLGSTGGNYPTGSVAFLNGTTQIGTGTISATGVATFSTTNLPAGTDTISASYAGDNNFNTSSSNNVTETVAKANVPSDVLTTSNASPVFGTSITLTDTLGSVNGTYPSGTVTFFNGSTQIGTGTLANGVATLTLANLPGGTDSVKATYGGDNTFNTANSNPLTITVTPVTGYGDVLSTSNATPAYGTSVTLTDTFAAVAGVYPTGTVTFYKGTTSLGTGTINASGVATLTTSSLPVGQYNVTAGYGGDTNFGSATSNAVNENVAKASGYGNVLTTSNANPSFNSSVTLTDTLAPVNGVYPTGSVTFYNGSASIGTGTISTTGVATLTLSSLPVGTDTITAGYLGDNTFAGSTSNAVTETVAKVNVASNVLTASTTSPAFGGSVTLTDTLSPTGGVYPGGTVTFYNGSTSIGTGTLSATGVATLTLSSLPVGGDNITASFPGDNTFNTSTSNSVTVTVAKASGYSDVLSTSDPAPAFGGSVTLTDTIAAVNGTYPTGTITFYNGSTSLGTGTLSTTGVATLTTNALPAGTDTVTAGYLGDTNFAGATSNALTETVAKATGYSDVLTTSNANPSFGASVTLTDTIPAVNGVYPTGTVTFYNGTTSLGSGLLSATGVATLTTSALPAGTDTVTAKFGGDNTFAGATSNALTETVAKASGYGDLLTTSNANPTYGNSITLTDTLAAVNGVYPTGTITFYNGTTSLGTGTLSATGVATLTTSSLPVGTDTVTAGYNGDGTFAGATSNAVTETVAKVSVAGDVLSTSNASPAFGSSVTLTDTLAPLNGTYPSGTITFYNGTTSLGTGTLSATGVATLTTSALPTGTDTVTASFPGDNTFSPATSNAITETVAKVQGTNTLTTSNASPVFGSSVTLTDTLSTVNGVAPTGTVTFSAGSLVLGTGSVSNGVATLTTSALPVGTDHVTASYGGDGNYNTSTSNSLTETVSQAGLSSNVLAASNTSPSFGQSITLTDTLAGVNGVVPTGTVSFYNGTSLLSTVNVDGSGVATLSTSSLPVGANTLHAVYNGDGNYTGATSNTVTVTVGKIAATNTDTATGSGTFGAPSTPVAITIPYAGPVAPAGDITVSDTHGNTVTIHASSCTVGSTSLQCPATLATASEPAGSNTLSVTQASDANYSGSTGTGTLTLTKASATTGDTVTGTGTYGAATTPVTVTIPYAGATPPTGTITVTDSKNNTVNIPASACTVAATSLTCPGTLATSNDPVGPNTATVSQAGDNNYTGSTGGGTITINKAPATSTDTASGTGTYGAASTAITVHIPYAGSVAPSGDITVSDTYNNSVVIPASGCTASAGTLTCTANLHTANEPLGTNTLNISQAADNNYSGSTGTGSVTIGPAAATSGDTATGSGVYGAPTTSVKVTIPYAGAGAPTGAISLNDTHNNTLTVQASTCTAASNTLTCTVTFPTASEPVGGNLLLISQAADASYAGSTGSGTITISKAGATTGDTASGTGTYGAATTPVTITIPFAGATAPTGSITLKDTLGNTVSIAASVCSSSGTALTCTANLPTANEPVGANSVTVSQTADGNYSGSTGSGTVTIGKAAATTADSASGIGTYGDATTQVLITIPFAGVTPPAGAITVVDNFGNTVTIQANTCVASGGALTCTASLPTANVPTGNDPVTVSQAGDANYLGSTGTGSVSINQAGSRGDDSVTGSGSYGAQSTPITVVIPFLGSAPTGTITVADLLGNNTTIAAASCKAAATALVCSGILPTANEPVGSNAVNVSQAADANHAASTGSGAIKIGPAAATSGDSGTGAGTYGAATTAVTVTIPFAGATAPAGLVTVTDSLGNTVSGPASGCSAANATLTCVLNLPTASEPLGSNAITVAQAADTNYSGSTGTGTVTITTSPVSPVGSTSSGVQNVTINQGTASTLLTATLGYGGAIPPSGAVTFTVANGSPVTATCSTGSSPETCTAMYPTASLVIGTYTITANEAADSNYTAGSATGTLTVAAGSVSPILDSISYVGNVLIVAGTPAATMTANITYTGPVPTGALTFNLPSGTPVTATCTAGPSPLTCTASYPTASLAAGSYVITAVEGADSNYPQGEATALLTVAASPSTPVSPILATGSFVNSVLVPYGTASASLYATIAFNGPPPTGAVSFTVIGGPGNVVQGVCTSGSSPMTCTADYPTATLGIGSYKIQVNVAADSNYPAGSAIGTLTVSEVAASTNDAVSGNGNYGDPTTPITVTIPYAGSITPTGAITVTDSYTNTVTIQASACTASASVLTCPGSLPTANVPLGTDAATVSQGPDAVYATSTGKGSITIGKATATTTDSATGTGTFGAATSPVTITIPYAGTAAPTGSITLSDSFGNTVNVSAQSCSAAAGTLTCNTTLASANEPLGSNPLTVAQAGDTNYTGSTGTGTLTIGKAGATTGDTATGTGTYGTPSTPVTITLPFTGSTAPTGAVTLTDTHNNTVSVQASSCTASTSTLTCNVTLATYSEPVGQNTVTVSQAADNNYAGSTGTGTVTINKAPATTGDTASGTGNYGGATTAVTVNIPYAGQAAPTGNVTVTDTLNNTVTVAAGTCTATSGVLTCTANLPTANEPVGSNNVTVSQAADINYSGSTGTGTVTINKAPVTTGDTATGTGTYGAPTTPVTVTIPYAGVTPPTGIITISDTVGETVTVPATSCTASNGVLSCTVNFPSVGENVGNNPLTVTQAGDSNYSGSNSSGSAGNSITISKAAAAADTASGTGTYGVATTPVTVTIPYTGAAPTGAITLADSFGNTVAVTACTTGTNVLTCTVDLPTANEPVGGNPVTVAQAADANHAASTGTGTVTINKVPATAADTALGTGIYGAATSTVTVTIPYTGQAAPTGAVTVTDSFGGSATVAGTTCTAGSGKLSCTVSLPTVNEPVGANPLTVTQIGDGNYLGSTGTGTMTISKAAAGADTATGTGTYGAATTPVTITIPYVGAVPTGAILLADTHNNSVAVPASACTAASGTLSCTANLPTSSEPVGANALTVSQAADANHNGSTGNGTLTINKAPATSTDSVTGTGTYGAATTNITVTIPYAGAVAPTGAITISDSLGNTVTVPASACTAAAGVLTCTAALPTSNEPLGTNTLTVTQAPDANYSGSTGTGAVTINKPGATTGDTVTGTGVYGVATTPVTVTIPFIGSTAPTGVITLTDTFGNTVTLQASICVSAKGVETCTANMPTASEPVGSNTVTVNQAADAIFNGSTGTGTITIGKAPASTGDTVTGSGTYGAATTSVTVTIPYTGAAAPTGAVTVADSLGNTVTVPASSCTAAKGVLTCTASLPTANEPVGTNNLTVTQAADANYSGSTGSGSVTLGKTKPVLTAPTVSPLNAAFGTSVTITQAVPAGETGTVTFFNGTTALGTATIANGVATLTTSALPVGTDSITATANGDANFAAATSPAVTDNVTSTAVTVTVASSQSTMTVGTSVTFTATVSAQGSSAIAGTITFYDGTTAVGTATVANGTATMSTATLAVGTHSVTASFTPASGSTLSAATSAAITQTVTQAATSLALTSSQNPAIVGQTVTLSATAPAAVAGLTPTGKVTFFDGTTALGTVQLNAAGVANFSTSALTGGMHNITASYAGDSNYTTATSSPVAQGISDYTVGNTTPTVGTDPGAAAAFNITVSSVKGINFNAPVVLTVTGLPANFTAAFAQGTMTPGSAGSSTTMTVQTFAQALTAMEHEHHIKTLETAAAWACLFPLLGLRRIRRRLPRSLLMLALMLGSFGVIAPLTGCGGGYFGPQPASYTLTVTGTSGTLQRSTTVTLNVH